MAGPGHGPGGRPPKGVKMKPQIENPGKVFKRLMSYVFQKYNIHRPGQQTLPDHERAYWCEIRLSS